jgi:membrane protease YdiL (CAAX protease family)
MEKIIKKHPIWSFLIINYIISWSFLYPSYQIILDQEKITPLALIGLIGAYGPTIAAIIVQRIIDKKSTKSLLRKLVKVKTNFKTILFIIGAPLIFYLIAYFLSAKIFNGHLNFNWFLSISSIPLFLLAALPFGPMGEELGWRGFMLPKLLKNYSLIKSTFLVGLAWGVWHFASFTFPGAALPSFFDVSIWTILLYFINTIALSFIFTFVYIKTDGSVFYAIMLHAFFNVASNVAIEFFGETSNNSILITSYILNLALAGICGFLLIKKESTDQSKLRL